MDTKQVKKDFYFLLRNHEKSINTDIEELKDAYIRFKTISSEGLKKIIKNAPKPTEIKINTFGAFLFGSFQSTYGELNKHNSPLYYGSVGSVDKSSRQLWVWTQSGAEGEGRLVWINKGIQFEKSYFFVKEDLKGLSRGDIEIIRKKGKGCSVFITKNSKHYEIKNFNLDDLIIPDENDGVVNKRKILKVDNSFTFFVLVLLVLVTLYFVFRTEKNKTK